MELVHRSGNRENSRALWRREVCNIPYPQIDPILFAIGPLAIRWYGLMYLFAFLFAWGYGRARARASDGAWHPLELTDLVFNGALGAVIGGRIGYVLFYGLGQWSQDFLFPIRVWEGGMSFHGGMLGTLTALALYARRTRRHVLQVTDFAVLLVPVGLGFGRLGNFINAELPGRVTELPWGLVFPGDDVMRHPSSLYQAFAEGLVLFVLLWCFRNSLHRVGWLSGMFLFGYGVLRFLTENFRKPDAHIGYIAWDWLTMGQLLSTPMILAGLGLLVLSARGAFGAPRQPCLDHLGLAPESADANDRTGAGEKPRGRRGEARRAGHRNKRDH